MQVSRRSFCAGAAVALAAPSLSGCGASGEPGLPQSRYFIFGEGDRRNLLYRSGTLSDLKTGEVVWHRKISRETFRATETAVDVVADGETIRIREDEAGVWVGDRRVAAGGKINRPRFSGPQAGRLRALHHELLVNIVDGEPLPNLFVYDRPWRRDSAMVAMVLARTGNLHLITPWIENLGEVFDSNAGQDEPDNIGQTLFLLSLAKVRRDHPLIGKALAEVRRFRNGDHIAGPTDGANHPAYQTVWLKTGLKALGLADTYRIPWQPDHYRSLAWWMPQGGVPYPMRFGSGPCHDFPYLSWAEAHYWNLDPPSLPDVDSFPQSWEANGARADYRKMSVVGHDWVEAKVAGPHGWHAAEAFLYLSQQV